MYEKLSRAFIMPNEIFRLGLSAGELATYAYLLSIENRKTYQCWPSYETIGRAIGKSRSSVKKYVDGLINRGLIVTEPTQIFSQNGLKRNGSLRYTILPIRNALNLFHDRQMEQLELAAARQQMQEQAGRVGTGTPLCEGPSDGADKDRAAPKTALEPLCDESGEKTLSQIEAQRSGFDLERKHDEMNELCRLRRSERYEVRADDEAG